LLEDYFHKGAVHVNNTTQGIRDGLRQMIKHHSRYKEEIEQLQFAQREEWDDAVRGLVALVDRSQDGTNESVSEMR
jgi:hypothetical protein